MHCLLSVQLLLQPIIFIDNTHTHTEDEENIQLFFSPNNKNDGLEYESVVLNRIKAKSEGLNPKSKHLPSYFFCSESSGKDEIMNSF